MNPTPTCLKSERLVARDVFDPGAGLKTYSRSRAFVEQGVEHIARPVGVGEQLPMRLFVERHTQGREPCDDITRWKGFEDSSDDGGVATVEVVLGDRDIRDVAARSAADQNLRAGACC